MPVAHLAEPIVIEVMNRGWANEDRRVTFRLQEEAAGVEVRAPAVDPEKASRYRKDRRARRRRGRDADQSSPGDRAGVR